MVAKRNWFFVHIPVGISISDCVLHGMKGRTIL